MAASLYIGKQFDPASNALGERVELDPSDLLTHGLIVGMTGSGKTGLAVGLIEETLRQGVPVLAIDPKGDLADLLLLFKNLDGPSFAPWVDPEAARRAGKTQASLGEETAAAWKKGLADWGLSEADVASLEGAREAVIYTPGSTSGIPLNILQSLDAPTVPFDSAAEDLRDEIAGLASGLLGLLGIAADPIQSREHILISALIEDAWRKGKGLTLESLVTAVANPPFDKLGALPVETVYPAKERQALMMSLNNLLASPSFAVFRQGEPLDVGALLRTPDGRPRLSVVYTAHLSDEERLFVTALLLDKVKTWIRQQGGTSALRALVYMDEVYGYFPPHPANPPTKRPLLTLLKQARAQGLGVVLATQNPVDLDYKALTNMGTWLVGTLQTEQDRSRLRDGLLGAGADAARLDALLAATRKRVFLLHDVHRAGLSLVNSRWAMSYLRGPLTPQEIERLMAGRRAPRLPSAAPAAPEGPPVLPSPLRHAFFKKYGGEMGEAHLLVKYAVRYRGAGESLGVRAYRLGGSTAAEIFESAPLILDEGAVTAEAPAGLRYGDLPPFVAQAGAKGLERAIKDRLPDKLQATLYSDPVTRSTSSPGETRDAFAARLQSAGGGASTRKLQDQIEKKKRDLAVREQELSGRKTEKWTAVGTAILSNIGLFMGRKRTVSGAGTVLTKNRLENTAEARVEALRAEIADLEGQLAAQASVDPGRFEEKTVVPSTGDVSLLRYDVVWVY